MKKTILFSCICISLQASSERIYQAGLFSTIAGNIATFIVLKNRNAPVPFPSLSRFGKSRAALAVTYAINYPIWFTSVNYMRFTKPPYGQDSHPSRYFVAGAAGASSQICALPFILPYAVTQKASHDAHYFWAK